MQLPILWDEKKNAALRAERGVSFEDVVEVMERGAALAIEEHPNQERYPGQMRLVVEIQGYAYLVPFVVDTLRGHIFLKTIIPSRRATKEFLKDI